MDFINKLTNTKHIKWDSAGQMEQKYRVNVHLRRNIWVYNRIFVRNHTYKQTFLTQSILYGN